MKRYLVIYTSKFEAKGVLLHYKTFADNEKEAIQMCKDMNDRKEPEIVKVYEVEQF